MTNHPPDMPHGINLPALRYLASRARGVSRTEWLELIAAKALAPSPL